jgi:hypothetical protein
MKKVARPFLTLSLKRQIARQVLPGLLIGALTALALLWTGHYLVGRLEAAIDATGARVFNSIVLLQQTRPACPQQQSHFNLKRGDSI